MFSIFLVDQLLVLLFIIVRLLWEESAYSFFGSDRTRYRYGFDHVSGCDEGDHTHAEEENETEDRAQGAEAVRVTIDDKCESSIYTRKDLWRVSG